MYNHIIFSFFFRIASHQIRHEATCKVGCQTGGCRWPLWSSKGVCLSVHGSTYSLYPPWGSKPIRTKMTDTEMQQVNQSALVLNVETKRINMQVLYPNPGTWFALWPQELPESPCEQKMFDYAIDKGSIDLHYSSWISLNPTTAHTSPRKGRAGFV